MDSDALLETAFQRVGPEHAAFEVARRFLALAPQLRKIVSVSPRFIPAERLVDIHRFRAKRLRSVGNVEKAAAADERANRLQAASGGVRLVHFTLDGTDFVAFLDQQGTVLDISSDVAERS